MRYEESEVRYEVRITSLHLCVSPFSPLLHLPRSAIIGTLNRSRPYSSSSSNRQHAYGDAVVEPRSMSLTLTMFAQISLGQN